MIWQFIKKTLSLSTEDDSSNPPDEPNKLIQEAMAQHQAGLLQEAEIIYRGILAEEPNNPDALHLLGLVAYQVGNNEVAIELIEKAIEANPAVPDFYNNCGEAYRALANNELSLKCYKQALEIKPDFAEAYNNMGNALKVTGRNEEATTCFEEAIIIRPDFFQAHYNLGNSLQEAGKLEQAISHYQNAISNYPDYAEAHNNIGIALLEIGKHEEAITHYQKAISLNPDYAEANNNLGIALQEIGNHENAITRYQKAISLNPDYAEAHFNLSCLYLLLGNFEKGYEEYEWRLKLKSNVEHTRSFTQPQWDGRPLNGKTILIHAEQGLGDAIQFIRYVPMIAKAGGDIIVECDAKLSHLFSGYEDFTRFIGAGDDLPDFDIHASLLSLPNIFKTTLTTIPSANNYIHINDDLVASWKNKLSTLKNHKIGICWQGSVDNRKDQSRSMPLKYFSDIINIPEVSFISLQKGYGQEKIKDDGHTDAIADFSSEMDTHEKFIDTSAIIENLNLVIGVDTATIHLAGAMGKPVWVLLPYSPDWRWMLNTKDTPWYPSMRLFRQKEPGDWETVMDEIRVELGKLITTL
jgi:tetratricopeptide (TPR) repeat protein